jgi:hypothetical protein
LNYGVKNDGAETRMDIGEKAIINTIERIPLRPFHVFWGY